MLVQPPPADDVSDDTHAALINIAGRQRMLSQRIVLFTVLAANGDAAALPTVQQSLTLFRGSHEALSLGGDGLPAPFTEELQDAFFGPRGIDRPVHEFIALVQHALRCVQSGQVSQAGLPGLVECATPLLGQLNTLTLSYEMLARRHAARQRMRQAVALEEMDRMAGELRSASMNARIAASRAGVTGQDFAAVADTLAGLSQRLGALAEAGRPKR